MNPFRFQIAFSPGVLDQDRGGLTWIGHSRLGTPSTVATVSGEVFYYISARTEQTSFLPEKVVDQRVVAVYFDKNRRVERIANYGLQDGKIFDYIGRKTPTSGQELSYLTYVFKIFGGK